MEGRTTFQTTVDFPSGKRVETKDTLHAMQGQISLKKQFDFPFEKRIETTDRLPIMEDQKIVETTVRFFI